MNFLPPSIRNRVSDPRILRIGLIGIVLGLATVVRVISLTSFGYNSDEAVYAGQAAAIVHDPVLSALFPIFRAHPLLYHFLLSLLYVFGVSEVAGRLLSAAFGIATVGVVYILGRELYGEAAGFAASVFLALMPYHVVVTRQVLLDGPMTFFAALALLLITRYARSGRPADLYLAGASLGLTFLAKETGVLFFGSVYVFFSLSPDTRFRFRDAVASGAIAAGLIALYPLTVLLTGSSTGSTARQYLVWQFFRLPNHTWDFYLRMVPFEIGPLVLLLAALGFLLLWKQRDWRETLLLAWIAVPVIFFQFWPTKGFQYLLPATPAVAVLAGRTIGRWFFGGAAPSNRPEIGSIAISLVAFTLLIPTFQRIIPDPTAGFLAGSGGVPGGREAGLWAGENLPDGSTLMTIGPSMANILQFYGNHRAYGLSVSANPLYRNPSYRPIDNPDRQILLGEIQYLVWDAFSARRSEFFSEKLLGYVQKYDGRVLHVESIPVETDAGEIVDEPVIIIYRVYP